MVVRFLERIVSPKIYHQRSPHLIGGLSRFVSFLLRLAHDKANQLQRSDAPIENNPSPDIMLLEQVEKLAEQILRTGVNGEGNPTVTGDNMRGVRAVRPAIFNFGGMQGDMMAQMRTVSDSVWR